MSEIVQSRVSSPAVDQFGVFASGACAAHCVVCALLPSALGAMGLSFLTGHEAEWAFTFVAIAFAAIALVMGWRRHRSLGVALLFVLGSSGLLLARFMEEGGGEALGTATAVGAAIALTVAHLRNIKAARCCQECS